MKRANKVKSCTEFQMTDKQSIKICLPTLENLWKQSQDAGQNAEIVIGVRRNENDLFIITGKLTIEKQRKA